MKNLANEDPYIILEFIPRTPFVSITLPDEGNCILNQFLGKAGYIICALLYLTYFSLLCTLNIPKNSPFVSEFRNFIRYYDISV